MAVRSAELWALHKTARDNFGMKQEAESNKSKNKKKTDIAAKEDDKKKKPGKKDGEKACSSLFTSAAVAVANDVRSACRRAASVVAATVSAVMDCTVGDDIDSSLISCEAAVVAAGSSLERFTAFLNTSLAEIEKRKSSAASWISGKVKSGMAAASHVATIQHLLGAASILDGQLSHWRLMLSLAREEIQHYRAEMKRAAKFGVLFYDTSCVPVTQTSPLLLHTSVIAKKKKKRQSEEGNEGKEEEESSSAPFLAKHLLGVRNILASKIILDAQEKFVERASSSGKKLLSSIATQLSQKKQSVMGSLVSNSGGGGKSQYSLYSLPPLPEVLSSEEREKIEGEANALIQKVKDTQTLEAKSVEMAVREISQLSSLITEKLVEQDEQMAQVEKNTAKSKENLEGANKELNKSKQSRWNATRTLIVLLWLCTAVVLFVHHVIR